MNIIRKINFYWEKNTFFISMPILLKQMWSYRLAASSGQMVSGRKPTIRVKIKGCAKQTIASTLQTSSWLIRAVSRIHISWHYDLGLWAVPTLKRASRSLWKKFYPWWWNNDWLTSRCQLAIDNQYDKLFG